ncbi:tetratricopeptide repeat protein [Methanocaldococcus fervens]|uniref:Tetratricopeptide TPR_2 repeat protein n=1 Tax=Methanocaldococcus fervens (strain DSM 4213 / JCM 15782 / AG86) TaxID=573064 RepID=C7P9G8_METFA|nr:tetratricopeptide repeat protein [Methanocaldococcus fervens]ACV25200.1 Tetratricopeptide TPR_2 repeat protein [Methanocaldococcus fervens AG86]
MDLIKKLLNKLISGDSSYYNLISEAERYLNEKDHEKAIECYLQAFKENKGRDVDWANLSYAYYQLGDYKNALEAINKALSFSPENPEFLYLKGPILYKLENFDEAYKCLIKASEKIKKGDLYEILGEISLKYKKYKKALDCYLKAYRLNKNNTNALFVAGKIYLLFGNLDRAYELFKKLLKEEPEHSCKEIVEFMDKIVESIEKNVYGDIYNGIKLLESKDYVNALKFFNKVIQIDEDNDIAHYYKSVVSEIFEDYQKALESIYKVTSIFERSIHYSKIGDILTKIGHSKAVEMYNKSIEIYPNPYAYFGLAIYYYRNGNIKKASNFFDKVLEIYVDDFLKNEMDIFIIYSLIGKAETTGIEKYYEGALQHVNKLLEKDIRNSELWKIKGYLLYKLKNYKEANECFTNALRLNPNDIDIMKYSIIVYEKAGKYDDVISATTKLKNVLKNDEADEIFKKLMNNEIKDLEIPSPLQNPPVMYYKIDHVQYYLANLYKYVNVNPIGAFIYLHFIENSDILEYINDEEKLKTINELLKELKRKLPAEMYKYCESPENYKPNKELVELCKKELMKFGYIV